MKKSSTKLKISICFRKLSCKTSFKRNNLSKKKNN